jgi:glycosyltransferase involved in cell wall biosynthesis
MAESAINAGYRVRVYSRWHPGQAPHEDRGDYELIRVPFDWRLAVPGLRDGAWRRATEAMAAAAEQLGGEAPSTGEAPAGPESMWPLGAADVISAWLGELIPVVRHRVGRPARRVLRRALALAMKSMRRLARPIGRPLRRIRRVAQRLRRLARTPRRKARQVQRSIAALPGRVVGRLLRPFEHLRRRLVMFPLGPLGWAAALERVAEPADIWHGMWAGSLPALVGMRARHGGRALYDSRDIFMESREWAHLRRPLRQVLQSLERRWSQSVDLVLTVNESYAVILERILGVPRPPVVMNCPPKWTPPEAAPDLIREALGLDPEVGVALYQGRLQSDRGIEQSMEAILAVPNAVLALLGFGGWERQLREQLSAPPYEGRVHLLPAVPPDQLIEWTASADVAVMAIQPTSLNHEWTTPQKLFESLAAGTPVVASDLPGMAEIVQPTGAGLLVDPESPAEIGAAIKQILRASPEARVALRERVRAAAWDRYNWEAQEATLLGLYRSQLAEDQLAGLRPRIPGRPTALAIRFVHEAGDLRGGSDIEVVLDPTWVAPSTSASDRSLAARDVVDDVFSSGELDAEAMQRVDEWADRAMVVERTTVEGTSFWFGLRLQFLNWMMSTILWLGVIRRLVDEHPEVGLLECPIDADPQLIEMCELFAEARGISFEASPPAAPVPPDRDGKAPPDLSLERPTDPVGRLLWTIWPPPAVRHQGALERRLQRLEQHDRGKVLVVEAHVPQRVNGPDGPRLVNAYLGPIVERLAATPLDPIEMNIRSDPASDVDWRRLNGPRGSRSLSQQVLEAPADFSPAAARERAHALAASIGADTSEIVIDGVDVAPTLRRVVARRVASSLPRREREVAEIRALLQRLEPAAVLIADEYHRQDWLAAAYLEGVPTAAVQHGMIHPTHVGYIHHRRPEELRLPERTYVFGSWERDMLVEKSVYKPDEVVVGGSPRLDLVSSERVSVPGLRHALGIEDGKQLVVLSGTWGQLDRQFEYPIALHQLFDRPLPGVHLVVKLHPSEPDEGPYRAVIENTAAAAGFEPPSISVVQDVDLYELLAAADAHLGIRSTVVTEAVLVGTPNLLASGLLGGDPLEYVRSGVAIPVRDGGDLLAALARLKNQRPSAAKRRAFVNAHFDPDGGARRIASDLVAWITRQPVDVAGPEPSS